ncbi:regulation of nuclear pre-mRNA domain-containing protein 2-like [Gigantopelta aegis]|uniref:regulation of nuclear pre-mRNA domain-containing protein 2-like n=1 Tax=Gigantopelta aegis TaxID=1735272 RepID=UPI001B88D154|nr:regulation of nuclear pre-mRNA domain-containing protein 2-like [Gigantopelta aegis]
MASDLAEESVQKKLDSVTSAQDSIQSMSMWIIHHKSHHKKIVNVWLKALKNAKTKHKLILFYLCNDVVQTCKKKHALVFKESFKGVLKEAAAFAREDTIKPKVERIFKIWEERVVYDGKFMKALKKQLNKKTVPPVPLFSESKVNSPIVDLKTTSKEPAALSPVVIPESAAVFDPKLVAEFKPSHLIEKITFFKKLETTAELKQRQLAILKMDASNLEAVRQLKDKAHGKEFSIQFEESCVKLEDYVEVLADEITERKTLIQLTEISEMFYDEQYREAKIVANAYKNFGTRIATMKKKLTDLVKTLPDPNSPMPSPVEDAPSPEATPPQRDDIETVDMEMSDDEIDQMLEPPTDAPSPDGSPEIQDTASENRDKISFSIGAKVLSHSRKGNQESLESRIASLVPTSEQQDNLSASFLQQKQKEVPVYNPSKVLGPGFASLAVDEGNSTPLADEKGGSTPVLDEVPDLLGDESQHNQSDEMHDAESSEPVKKQNPIDFLTTLISNTKKNAPVSSDFLQNLTLLTSTVKTHIEQEHQIQDGDSSDSATPKSWAAWKAKVIQTSDSETSDNSPQQIMTLNSKPVTSGMGESPPPSPIQTLTSHTAAVGGSPPAEMQTSVSGQPPVSMHSLQLPPTSTPQSAGVGTPVFSTAPPLQGQPPQGQFTVPGNAPPFPNLTIPPPHTPMPNQFLQSTPPTRPPMQGPPPPTHLANMLPPQAPGQGPPLGSPFQGPQNPPPLPPPGNAVPGSMPRFGLDIRPPPFAPPPHTSSGFNPMACPPPSFFSQQSPGQKENWTGQTSPRMLGQMVSPPDQMFSQRPNFPQFPSSQSHMPHHPPKGILRNKQPILGEMHHVPPDQMMDHAILGGPKPPSVPPSPMMHLSESNDDLQEFREKLKRKTTESQPDGPPKMQNKGVSRQNLTTITLQDISVINDTTKNVAALADKETHDEADGANPKTNPAVDREAPPSESSKEHSEDGTMKNNSEKLEQSEGLPIQLISTVGSSIQRIETINRHNESISRIESVGSSHTGSRPVSQIHSVSNQYDRNSDYRDDQYSRNGRDRDRERDHHQSFNRDRYRDEYSRDPYNRDVYGAPPAKRRYPETHDSWSHYNRY